LHVSLSFSGQMILCTGTKVNKITGDFISMGQTCCEKENEKSF
jgi:hypothetical protein